MTDIYYLHRTGLNFYCESVFGSRFKDVIDPEWMPPLVYVPDPDWTPNVESLGSSAEMIAIPDEDVPPRLIRVANPDCLLPPEDELIELTEAQYLELSHASAFGKVIALDEQGYPCLVDLPPPSLEQQREMQRQWRDRLLQSTDTLIIRHRDEAEAGRPTSLQADQYQELQGFRMDLRDWPQTETFPDLKSRPQEPLWLSSQLN